MPMTARDQAAAKVCVGEIVAPHGVGGAVKVRCFTAEPKDILAYGPVTDELGRRGFGLSVAGTTKGGLICRLDGFGMYIEPMTDSYTDFYQNLLLN